MTNEQTIDAIMKSASDYVNSELAYNCVRSAVRAGKADRRRDALRHAITAALAAKDAEIADLKQRLADSVRDLQTLKASPAPEQEPSAWRIKQGARVYLISHAEFVRTSFDAASMTPLYEKSLPSIDHAPTTEPGEWVEWNGVKCPIADGVQHQVRLRNGGELNENDRASAVAWDHQKSARDIIAYRIIT